MNVRPPSLAMLLRITITGPCWAMLTGPADAQTLFHTVHEYDGWPGSTENALPLPGGSYILYSGGQYPHCGSLSKVNSAGVMQWNMRVEFPMSGGGGSVITTALLDPEQKIIMAITGAYPGDGALVRMDTNAIVLWTRQIEHPLADVILTADGNYAAFGGATLAAEGSDWDLYFYKVAPDGTVLTSTHYVNPNPFINYDLTDKTGFEIIQDPAGAYYLAFMYNTRTCLMKLDASGVFQWMKVLWDGDFAPGFGTSVHAWRMFLRSDGSLLLCGKPSAFLDPPMLVSIHVSSTGQVLGATRYESTQEANALDAMMAPDSTIYFWTQLQLADNAVVRIAQDRSLLETWRVTYSPARVHTGLSVDPDGAFDLFSMVPDTSMSNAPMDMERVDGTFITECASTDSPVFTEAPIAVAVIDSFPLATFNAIIPDTNSMIWTPRAVVQLQPCISVSVPSISATEEMVAYPSPTNGHLSFHPSIGPARLQLLDARGALVRVQADARQGLSMEGLLDGIYLLQVLPHEGPMRCTRVIKE